MASDLVERLETIATAWEEDIAPDLRREQESRLSWRRFVVIGFALQFLLTVVIGVAALYAFNRGEHERQRLCHASYAQADALVGASRQARPDETLPPDEQARRQAGIDAYYDALDRDLEGICSPPNRNP